ncbi:FAD/NAD(P)-binding domain-containing protein [Pleurotus eryngii]|uniref:FAD/NAD(P)-binding domain-containing protein n=1 Tax=Pleurotus eryngii TaxID=5323 RepID=A0A9P6DK62_PLEER|nr:FAD/NAD(P)-binding domain-containing protein [Pleurotus eryngii]
MHNSGRPRAIIRVAICGGSISGLCLAVALSKASNVEVNVYESAQRFSEIGAGVMIWSRTWRILEQMGLADAFSRIAHAPPDGSMGIGFDYRRSDGPEGFDFYRVQMPYGCIRFHRAQFLDVLIDRLPAGVAHFGKRLRSYSQSNNGPIGLRFSDGSMVECDVLLGCDGIKSVIRAQMLRDRAKESNDGSLLDLIDPVWSGTIAYRGLIPAERLNGKHRAVEVPMMYCGQDKHVVSYSISQSSVVNVVTFSSNPNEEGRPYGGPWVVECEREELLESYSGWEPEVGELLQCIDNPTKWAIHQLKPLPFFVSGRVALIGDSAHAMVPHQGAGAGQAIEDAYIIACLISRASEATVDLALQAYELVRLPVANHVLEGSAESGKMYEFNSQHGDDYRILGRAIEQQWNWIHWPSPNEDLACALDWVSQQLTLRREGGYA